MREITLESIAKHCIDNNITSEQIAYMLETQAELKRLQRLWDALSADSDIDIIPTPGQWRLLARALRRDGYLSWPIILDAIADVLEEDEMEAEK